MNNNEAAPYPKTKPVLLSPGLLNSVQVTLNATPNPVAAMPILSNSPEPIELDWAHGAGKSKAQTYAKAPEEFPREAQ